MFCAGQSHDWATKGGLTLASVCFAKGGSTYLPLIDGRPDPLGDSCPAPDTAEAHYLIGLPPRYGKLTRQVAARRALSEGA